MNGRARRRRTSRAPGALRALGLWPCWLLACNVTPATPTGGAELPARGECPRGLAVVSSDFQSTEVALLSPEGEVRSAAFISSAVSAASGLAAPLSGDVVAAASLTRPHEIVLVDRLGTNVLSFVDARTASVRAQLPVGTGFDANPQDYLELDERRAFVPRLSENREPGREPFDSGSDLLELDPSVPAIVGSLPLPRQPGFWPAPAALARFSDLVLVTLLHARPDYSGMADGELVGISVADHGVRYRVTLAGLKNCGRVEVSTEARFLAVACASYVDPRGAAPDPSGSGIVLLDAAHEPPRELKRFAATELVGGPVQSGIELVNDELLLFKSQTALGSEQDNELLLLDLTTGRVESLAGAARDAAGLGFGVALGGMSCRASCGDPCLVADASRGHLLRFRLSGGGLLPEAPVEIAGAGLPPRGVTPFW